MAIAQRGSGTSGGATGANDDTVTMTKPTGLAVGDLLFAVITTNNQSVTAPSGWTLLFNLQGTANTTWRTHAYYKIATSTETAASNFTFTVPNADSPVNGTLTAWSGVDTTTPIGTNYATLIGESETEPYTGPTATNGASNGRVLYVRSVRQPSASDNSLTLTEAVAGKTLIVSRAAYSGGSTVYANAQFADDADFSGGGNKTGLATTCNKTESDNVTATIVLKMLGVPATGDMAMTLQNATMAFAATREIPAGSIALQLQNATIAFAGEAAPPSGSFAMQLNNVTEAFEGYSDGAASMALQLSTITKAFEGAVNPIGDFALQLNSISMAFVSETVPFGEHVIHIEPEHRAFHVIDDDPGLIPIKRSEVTQQ